MKVRIQPMREIGALAMWRSSFITRAVCALLGTIYLSASAQDVQTLAERARVAAEAARMAIEAAEVASKAAKAAKEAAEAASTAAAAAAAAATSAGKPAVLPSSAAALTSPVMLTTSKAPGAELSTYLTAGSDGGSATIKLAHRLQFLPGDLLYSFSLSSPLSKESTFTEPATLDGMANGANLSFALGKYFLVDPSSEDTGVWSFGGLARIGYSSFKYLDATSLAKMTEHRRPTTVGGYVGLRPSGETPVFLLAKYEYQHVWKDADTKVLCPDSVTFPVTCVNGPIGAPAENRKRLFSLSVRYTNPRFDIAPTITYDRASKVKGIDFPVYLIKGGVDEKNTLPFNAGLRFGWRSDTRDASVGLFVGSPFSLYTP